MKNENGASCGGEKIVYNPRTSKLNEDQVRSIQYALYITETEREILVSALGMLDHEMGLTDRGHQLKGSLHLKLIEQ